MTDTVYFYRDAAGEWRWKRQSPNGNIVSDSGEGYKNHDDCKDEAMRQFGDTVRYVGDDK